MAVTLINPPASFVQFNTAEEHHCVFGIIAPPLPVVYSNDVAFQIVLQADSEGEASAIYGSPVNFGLVSEYGDLAFLIQFPNTAVRSKLAPTQILYNWGAGFPSFQTVIAVNECFRVMVELNGQRWYSKTFKRIAIDDDTCWSAVIAYASTSGGFGFFGCGPVTETGTGTDGEGGGTPVDEEGNCIPMIVDFVNVPNLTIPITQGMRDAYSELPSVQVWGYDGSGNLINMGIGASFGPSFPPDYMYFDFGGPLSGKIRIGS